MKRAVRVAADGADHVYVVDLVNSRVQAFTNNGVYFFQWGSFGTGDGQFRNPIGVAVDAGGDIFVADKDNYRVQVFGSTVTPARLSSWGRIKSMYR